ncbi:MAG: MarR family transcriptional regulator [Ruminococcaceae bacterium]|nr:MarR family transcriptional regulator [Oscillospiraceae bacterium]
MFDDDEQKLDVQVCFALYVASKELIRKYKPFLDPYRLTYTGYITLMALWEKDDVSVKELGEKLYLDSGTLTPLLKKLEKLNYVTRVKDEKDERTIKIKLTSTGRQLKKDMEKIPQQVYSEAQLGNVKSILLLQTLRQLIDDMTEKPKQEEEQKASTKKDNKKDQKKKR